MMHSRVSALLVICALAAANGLNVAQQSKQTPLAKVITLLKTLSKQVYDEGTKEAVSYDKYSCFCKAQAESKLAQIAKEDERIARLHAAAEEENGLSQYFTNEGGVLRVRIGLSQEEQAAALAIRQNQTYTYQHRKLDLESAIQATTRAIAVMESAVANAKQVTSLMEIARDAITKAVAHGAIALKEVQSPEAETTGADPLKAVKGPVYKYQSKDMVGVMKGLDRSFRMDLARLELEEGNLQSDYNQIEGARAYQLAAFRRDRDEKERLAAEQIEYWRRDQGLMDEEVRARQADQDFLDDLTAQCQQKAADWDERAKARAAELTVLEQSIEVLSGMTHLYRPEESLITKGKPEVVKAAAPTGIVQSQPITLRSLGSGKEATPVKKAPALLQIREVQQQRRVQPLINFLENKASTLKSAALYALVNQLSQEGDHFVKVRQLLKDLMQRLTDDAAAEANQKGFCDEQMNQAVTTRDQKKEQMENYHSEIDAAKTDLKRVRKEIKELQGDLAELHSAVVETALMRTEDQASNEKRIEDANAGMSAVVIARQLLEQFYQSSLIQTGQTPSNSSTVLDRNGVAVTDLAPETFSGQYNGKTGETAGIMGLLDIVVHDFETTIAETKAAENKGVKEYEKMKEKLQSEITDKQQVLETKKEDEDVKDSDLKEAEENLRTASELHGEALDSLEALKSSCVENSETKESRERARKAEIEALKQAATILEDWK